MAVHATLQWALQLVEDAKTKDVWGPFWQRKSTASGLRWKVAWRMWLVYSWAISQLSCLFCIVHAPKIRSPPQVDKIGPVKTPFPPQVDKNPYESTVTGGTLDIASRTTWQLCHDSGHVCYCRHCFHQREFCKPLVSLPCFYFEVCTESIWLLISCIHALAA